MLLSCILLINTNEKRKMCSGCTMLSRVNAPIHEEFNHIGVRGESVLPKCVPILSEALKLFSNQVLTHRRKSDYPELCLRGALIESRDFVLAGEAINSPRRSFVLSIHKTIKVGSKYLEKMRCNVETRSLIMKETNYSRWMTCRLSGLRWSTCCSSSESYIFSIYTNQYLHDQSIR